ncbi:MAG: hypothetical protein KGH61_04735 [Candidatus Micrarchaeota archaeon]|nr:hypothetical protein [Candidatus Micrarchaeota archaeon]MDE1848223.1 hypothetical protein [Candidatus Micrarchaeota archaeon]MDE1864891.1 hypothetical protein [Candidatus Micrarchaeota archaeon]
MGLRNLSPALIIMLITSSFIPLAYATAGHAYVSAAAVTGLGTGDLTTFVLNTTQGDGNITISGPSSVDPDTLSSAYEAVGYATKYLNLSERNYNFSYTIFDNSSSVSGPSGGLAFTLLAVSALSGTKLMHNFGVTGTIDGAGNVGQIGGIYEKSSAAKFGGKQFMIVPLASSGSFEQMLYYIAQQRLGIQLVMASNLTQALGYADGSTPFSFLSYNTTFNYHVGKLQELNITCSNCDMADFKNLTNATFSFTRQETGKIPGNFGGAKQGMLGMMGNYSSIAAKGYLYSGADLSFQQFINAFVLANSNFTKSNAKAIVANVSDYCSLITPPAMTSDNYEYVIGGEMRQTWALITLNESSKIIANASTTDDLATAISQAGTGYAWCLAANQMYAIAAKSNSSYVTIASNSTLAKKIYSMVAAINTQTPGLYQRAALQDYRQGMYGAALYNVEYANWFDTQLPNYNESNFTSAITANIANSTSGIWPFEFAAQALFYLSQAHLNVSTSQSYIQSAYSTSLLSRQLGVADGMLTGSFTSYVPSQVQASQLLSISQQIQELFAMMLIVIVLLLLVLVVLIAILVKHPPQAKSANLRPAQRARRR